jgi:hypothetical protein
MAEAIEHLLGLLRAAPWPAAVGLAIVLLVPRVAPKNRVNSWLYVFAFVAAYCLGHAIEAGPDWTLRPARNWQWMFYLAPAAGIIGAMSTLTKATWTNRCLMIGLLAALAAGLLTLKPVLWAPRPASVVMLFAYLFLLWAAATPLERAFSPGALSGAYALAAAALSVMISEQISLSDGLVVVAAAAGLAGVALGAWLAGSADQAVGLSVPFAITVGGWAWIETLSEVRLWPLLLVPIAPLALWVTRTGPLVRLRGPAALAVPSVAILIVIVVASVLLRFTA